MLDIKHSLFTLKLISTFEQFKNQSPWHSLYKHCFNGNFSGKRR